MLPYGEVSGGHKELSAVLRRAWYGDPMPYDEMHWLGKATTYGKLSEDVSDSVHQRLQILGGETSHDSLTYGRMDVRPSCAVPSCYSGEVFCVALWVHVTPQELCHTVKGLMLIHKKNDIYRRIGWFASSTENFDGLPIQTITIV